MMRVEIRVYNEAGEFMVLRRQPFDKLNRPTATPAATLKAAYDDAVAWLRRTSTSTTR